MKREVLRNQVYLALFAKKDLPAGTELRYDYGVSEDGMPWRKSESFWKPIIVPTEQNDFGSQDDEPTEKASEVCFSIDAITRNGITEILDDVTEKKDEQDEPTEKASEEQKDEQDELTEKASEEQKDFGSQDDEPTEKAIEEQKDFGSQDDEPTEKAMEEQKDFGSQDDEPTEKAIEEQKDFGSQDDEPTEKAIERRGFFQFLRSCDSLVKPLVMSESAN
ncbi:17S U2 SnRNP complex component HTATSF1-like [Clytia hemisphaerica]|uniref:17S U2 SnRNP complex component HTATSF1-like n=1 Tax=Clytia hemisphaerica TaxID=252671 RepID=UPI0034D5BECC